MSTARDTAASALREAITEIEQEIARVRAEADERLRLLRRERTELLRGERALRGEIAPRRTSAKSIAGPGAIATVDAFLRKEGQAFQVDITKATGLNSGTVTHALRALAAEGKIVATENQRGRSQEFAHTDAAPRRRRAKAAA